MKQSKHSTKARSTAANLALAATAFLTLSKLAVALVTGSVGVLSEAIHSGLDLVSSLVTFFVVRASIKPADWDHPFGHGKIESISALFESALLIIAGGYILYESLAAWYSPTHHIHYIEWGLGITAFSIVLNLFVYFQNKKVAHAEESIAIETNAFHFLTDVFSSLAAFIGLLLVEWTGRTYFDVLIGILISFYVFWIGMVQIKKCVAELSDTALPPEEIQEVWKVLESHKKDFLDYHDLRTRKAGALRYVDFHLTLCADSRVQQAHDLCDEIENGLKNKFPQIDVNIHIEPCGHHSENCEVHCKSKKGKTQ